jgi:hypothetical protein
MHDWSFTIITIILSSIILLVLKYLANLIVTRTLKYRRVAWLCLIEGHLASLND